VPIVATARRNMPSILMRVPSCRTFRRRSFRGVALANELYLEGGIRSVEIGPLMFGEHAKMDLVRLAIPRRAYTQSHIEYVVEVILDVWRKREQIRGYEITHRPSSCGTSGSSETGCELRAAMNVTIDPKLKPSARERRLAA